MRPVMSYSWLLCLLISQVMGHRNVRYQSVSNMKAVESSVVSRTENFDSLGLCASYCNYMRNDCTGFASRDTWKSHASDEDFRGFQCEFYFSNFTSYKASSSGWLLWEPRTTTSPARSVSSVTPAEPEPECPVVWRQWPADNDTIGAWAMSMSESADVDKAVDGDNSTVSISPSSKAYPYYQIDLGRGMRVTKVAILGGDNPDTHPMENLEVKVGNSSITGWDGNVKITSNTRCGVYYGPTQIAKQWIEIDCGFSKGLYGRFITFQLLERRIPSGGGNLEMAEIEVYGWGRVCNKDV